MEIRLSKTEEIQDCLNIARSLDDWFDDSDLVDIEEHLRSLPVHVAVDSGVVGYVCMDESLPEAVEIKDMAVAAGRQRRGIGAALIKYVENQYSNKKMIVVKTLDESREYEPYARTRSFYEKNGFVKVDVINPYPGWSDSCPCAIYAKPNMSLLKYLFISGELPI